MVAYRLLFERATPTLGRLLLHGRLVSGLRASYPKL